MLKPRVQIFEHFEHVVRLRASDDIYYVEPFSNHCLCGGLMPDIKDWLDEQVGPNLWVWLWTPFGLEFSFSKSCDAVNFKLRWA